MSRQSGLRFSIEEWVEIVVFCVLGWGGGTLVVEDAWFMSDGSGLRKRRSDGGLMGLWSSVVTCVEEAV